MVTTASIARVAALIGDPTRASMLQALMEGRAGAVAGLARLRLDRPLKKAGARSSPVDADDAAASQGRSADFRGRQAARAVSPDAQARSQWTSAGSSCTATCPASHAAPKRRRSSLKSPWIDASNA